MSNISIMPIFNFSANISEAEKKAEAKKIEQLIKFGLNVNKKHERGETLLFKAASRGNKYAVEVLLINKADPNIPGEYGSYPLYEAVNNNYEDIALILLHYGAKVLKISQNKFPILHAAAHFGNKVLIKPLIKAGANINEITNILFSNSTALIIAYKRNNLQFADELISLGAKTNEVIDIKEWRNNERK